MSAIRKKSNKDIAVLGMIICWIGLTYCLFVPPMPEAGMDFMAILRVFIAKYASIFIDGAWPIGPNEFFI